jgi:hypothetical protein
MARNLAAIIIIFYFDSLLINSKAVFIRKVVKIINLFTEEHKSLGFIKVDLL